MRIIVGGSVLLGLALAATVSAAAAGTARPQDVPPAENRYPPYTGVLPLCSDPEVLKEISWYFGKREAEFWNSDLAIVSFEAAKEYGYRSSGESYIPRRYCTAEAVFNDGARRKVVYNIGEALGFIGIGSGVTWCVEGLDRNHAFSPNCRAAGP